MELPEGFGFYTLKPGSFRADETTFMFDYLYNCVDMHVISALFLWKME